MIRPRYRQPYVYLVENQEKTAMKIGTSVMPEVRAAALACRLLYTLRGNRQAEQLLHKKFRHLRLSGEWFKHSEQISGYFIQSGGRVIKGKSRRNARANAKGMASLTVLVPKDLIEAIRLYSANSGKFMHQILREAIEMWLKKNTAALDGKKGRAA